MIKTLLIFSLLFTHSLRATEINHTIGFGLQYAGVVGYQISAKNDVHRFRGALGLVGLSIGYDYFLSPKWSLGATYTETLRTIYSLNINYYANKLTEGFNFGVDLGSMPEDDIVLFNVNRVDRRNFIFFSVGYVF